jgi:hypothetical protein
MKAVHAIKAKRPPQAPVAPSPPPFSDEDLALRFAARHAADTRYVANWGQRTLCRDAAAECKNRRARKGIASAKTVAAVVSLARADRRLAATIDQWDRDPWLLNTPEGTVDLRTEKIRAHRPKDYLTKITAVGPHGDCPRFKAFLVCIMRVAQAAFVGFAQRGVRDGGRGRVGVQSEIARRVGSAHIGRRALGASPSWRLRSRPGDSARARN